MENNTPQEKKLHSEQYFGEQRNFWWNQDFIQLMAQRWNLKQVKSMLDIGCGIGHWGRLLASHLHDQAKITGIDQEIKWIEKSQAAHIARPAHYLQASVYQLPFEDNSFDMVTCQTVLIHLKNPNEAIKEFLRVLKPNGLLAVAEPNNTAQLAVRSNLEIGMSVDERLKNMRFHMLCEQGKNILGEGDNSIGDFVPGLFQQLGLQNIQTFLSDKATALFPKYEYIEQKVLINDFLSRIEKDHNIWDKEDTLKYFIAGGGSFPDFESEWESSKKYALKVAKAMTDSTFQSAGGQIFYLVSGRK